MFLWWSRWVGWAGVGGRSKRKGYGCTYGWLISLYSRNQYCKATILQFKKKSVPFVLHLAFFIHLCGFSGSLETTKTLKAFSISMKTPHQHTEPWSWELKASLTFLRCPTFPRGNSEVHEKWRETILSPQRAVGRVLGVHGLKMKMLSFIWKNPFIPQR